MLKINTKNNGIENGSKYVHTEQIQIDGKTVDYDFIFTEQKLINLMRILRTDFGINTIEQLNDIDKENMIAHIHLFDLLVDIIVDDKKMAVNLQTGLSIEGMSNFFELFVKCLENLTKKLEKKASAQKGGHRSTNGKQKRK